MSRELLQRTLPKKNGQRIEGRERPRSLPPTIRKVDGRWFGDARVIFEGVQVDFIYAGINDHQGHGRFPRHSHPFSELFYTVSGEGNMICGPRVERCRAGHIFLARPGEPHASSWQATSRKPWRGIIIQFNLTLDPKLMALDQDLTLARILAPAGTRFFVQREGLLQLPVRDAAWLGRSTDRLLQLLREHPDGGTAFVVAFWIELMALLSDALRRAGWRADRGLVVPHSQKEQQLLRARQLLDGENGSGLEVDAVAREAGMSKFHFVREFRRFFGVPPAMYRTGLAMERAGKVLLQTDETVAEVAERMGYADSSAFIKAFRRHMGMAPHAYRVLHGSG